MFTGQIYVFYLVAILIVSEIIKDKHLFKDVIGLISTKIKNQKLIVFLTSMLFGVLPIPGRIIMSSGIINSMAKNKLSYRIGIVEYLSTHHYYFWSPLEKTVILPMALLGISYLTFIEMMYPLILITITFLAVYILFFVDKNEIKLNISKEYSLKNVILVISPFIMFIVLVMFKMIFLASLFVLVYFIVYTKLSKEQIIYYVKNLNFKLIILFSLSLFLGTYIKSLDFNISSDYVLYGALISFAYSFLMGSSSKYAMSSVLFMSTFGFDYAVLFLVVEFIGYILSPMHKCFWVAMSYYEMNIYKFLFVIILWLSILLGYTLFIP